MMDALNQSRAYSALYMGVESAQSARNDVACGMTTMLGSLVDGAALHLNDERLAAWRSGLWAKHGPDGTLKALLSQ
ncbi:MAG: hypothetical protein KDI44_04615 [Thiothrix sp.]|nr:hypothetical protein [Thiothrix sp.]HPQ94862.1 hypothetical protein [Thiolinea sp.]